MFYEKLGLEARRESPIVRNGELGATNSFFGVPGQDEELELTFDHDGLGPRRPTPGQQDQPAWLPQLAGLSRRRSG